VDYRDDYPKEPIGGSNPYWRCKSCHRSAPGINGQLDRHETWCNWRKTQEAYAHAAAMESAVNRALAEYDDPNKSLTSTTATRMADILRNALNGKD
jgi:hypothetical protein